MPASGYPAPVYVAKVSWGILRFFDIQATSDLPLGGLGSSFFLDTRLQSCSLVVLSQPCVQSYSHSCSSEYIFYSTSRRSPLMHRFGVSLFIDGHIVHDYVVPVR
jgi:hypothetical protein